MTAEDLLRAMGFEHEQFTGAYDIDGIPTIGTTHVISHPKVSGLMLFGSTIEKAMKPVVGCIQILSVLNDQPEILKRWNARENKGDE